MLEKFLKRIKERDTLIFMAIVAVAIFFRFYKLGSLPPGLHPDEAANGLDMIGCFEKGNCRVFYNTNGPREALFFYMQWVGIKLFGFTQFGIRFAAGVVSTLAIVATYFLGKELFGKRVGQLSGFFMALLPWYLVISRDGFRANLAPLFIATTLYFGVKAYRTKKLSHFVLFGASFGLGFHSYLAYRLFPLVFIALGFFFLLFRRDLIVKLWGYKKELIVSALAFTATLLPLILYFIKNPGDAGARSAGTSILNPDLNGGNPVGMLIENLKKTALMFNFKGDENYRHNLGGAAMLDPIGGIAFIIGLFLSFKKIFKWEYFILLVTFAVMLLPMILTAEGIPHGLRAVGIAPIVAVFTALGINVIWTRWEKDKKDKSVKILGIVTLASVLLFSLSYGYIRYFKVYALKTETYDAYSEDMVMLSKKLNETQPQFQSVLVIGEYSEKTVSFLSHKKASWTRVEPRDLKNFELPTGKLNVYIQLDMLKDAEVDVLNKLPDGKMTTITSSLDGRPLFYLYQAESQ